MSQDEIEKKITELEQSNLGAHQSVAGLVELNRAIIGFQKEISTRLFNWTLSLDNRNAEALQLVRQSLPEEAARKLGDILARSMFDRDQLEAMIRKLEALPSFNPSPTPSAPSQQ